MTGNGQLPVRPDQHTRNVNKYAMLWKIVGGNVKYACNEVHGLKHEQQMQLLFKLITPSAGVCVCVNVLIVHTFGKTEG